MAHAHLAFELDGFEDPEETVAENINGIHGKALAVSSSGGHRLVGA